MEPGAKQENNKEKEHCEVITRGPIPSERPKERWRNRHRDQNENRRRENNRGRTFSTERWRETLGKIYTVRNEK